MTRVRPILKHKMLASICVCMCHADFLGVLSLCGEFEVSLEPARQGHAIFRVIHPHAISTQFGLFQLSLGYFYHDGYSKAKKFNGDNVPHFHPFFYM